MKTATHVVLVAAMVVVSVWLAGAAAAGTRRDDVLDLHYTNLANHPLYAAVGKVTQGGGTGSGVLISRFGGWVLTAGHVVDNHADPLFFELGGTTYEADEWFPHSGFDWNIIGGYDIGLIHLVTAPTGVATAVRYRGTYELGQKGTSVGYGRTGTGLTGDSRDAGTKRAGENTIEVLGGALGYSNRILMADFDNPSDPGASTWGFPQPLPLELCPAPGDSGGGLFIQAGLQNWLAGITSFLVHESEPWWGNPMERIAFYGDTVGWTRVSAFNDWIDSYVPNYWKYLGVTAPFSQDSNWESGVIPGATGTAMFDMLGLRTVTFSENITNRKLHQAHGNFTFALAGFTYEVTDAESLLVGDEAGENAKLIPSGGTLLTGNTFLGRRTSAIGSVETTAGAEWTNSGSVYVGGSDTERGGAGSLIVGAGTTVTIGGTLKVWSLGISGSIAVSGTASAAELDLGVPFVRETPELKIFSGGTLTTGDAFIGKDANTTASAVIESGATWTNTDDLYVAGGSTDPGGTGTVTVLAGGLLEVGGTLQIWPDGTVNVAGGTVRFAVADPLDDRGGALNYYAGTVEFDCDVTVGAGMSQVTEFFGDSPTIPTGKGLEITGTATLGTPVTINGGTLSVGSLVNPSLLTFNTGTFNLTDDDLVVGPGGLFGSTLTLPVGKAVNVTHNAVIEPFAELALSGGTFTAGSLTNSGGTLGGTGTITGDVTINPGGTLAPGASVGTLTLNDDLTFAAGGNKWVAELLGAAADSVTVTGDLTLGDGTALELVFGAADPFQAGTYTLASYANLAGTFSSETDLGAYSTGVVYGANAITIELEANLLPGDATLDRNTNFSDYVRVSNNYGIGTTWAEGDVTGDGAVNFSDYVRISNNYGSSAPEPATLAILAMGGAWLAFRRRRHGTKGTAMRNVLKKMVGLGAALLALVVAAGACQAAIIIEIRIDVSTGQAYLFNPGDSGDWASLVGYTITSNGSYLLPANPTLPVGVGLGGLAPSPPPRLTARSSLE